MFDLRVSTHTVLLIISSLFFASFSDAKNIENHELPKSKLTLELEFSDESAKSSKDKIISLVDAYLFEGEQLFGGPPKKLSGDSYTRLRIKLSNSGFGGETDPEFIELRSVNDKKLFGFYGWEISLLHEVLHLWSGETFKYADSQEQWFNEGVTEYLTYRIAAKLGLIEKDNVLNAFSKPIGTYLSAKGIGKYSLRGSARTDELKKEHYFLVYHGGFTAGMVLDHQIRMRSNGEFTLDRLMSDLYKTHSREKPYSTDSILELIKESTKIDFSHFFKQYIYGSEIIPVGNYFDIGWLIFNEIGAPIGGKEQQSLADMLTFD